MVRLPVARSPRGTYLELRPGMSVLLQAAVGSTLREYPTAVEEVRGNAVMVLAPMEGLRYRWLRPGQEIVVQLRERGKGYLFTTVVTGAQEVPHPLIELELPDKVHTFDRREFYRLSVTIQPRAANLLDADGKAVGNLEATVLDLSGGGLQFMGPAPLAPGARVRFELPLGDPDDVITLTTEVLNARAPEPGHEFYRFNAKFESLTERDRQRIIRFIFQQQIELRKKGLL